MSKIDEKSNHAFYESLEGVIYCIDAHSEGLANDNNSLPALQGGRAPVRSPVGVRGGNRWVYRRQSDGQMVPSHKVLGEKQWEAVLQSFGQGKLTPVFPLKRLAAPPSMAPPDVRKTKSQAELLRWCREQRAIAFRTANFRPQLGDRAQHGEAPVAVIKEARKIYEHFDALVWLLDDYSWESARVPSPVGGRSDDTKRADAMSALGSDMAKSKDEHGMKVTDGVHIDRFHAKVDTDGVVEISFDFVPGYQIPRDILLLYPDREWDRDITKGVIRGTPVKKAAPMPAAADEVVVNPGANLYVPPEAKGVWRGDHYECSRCGQRYEVGERHQCLAP